MYSLFNYVFQFKKMKKNIFLYLSIINSNVPIKKVLWRYSNDFREIMIVLHYIILYYITFYIFIHYITDELIDEFEKNHFSSC
jgi:hypothetical protein